STPMKTPAHLAKLVDEDPAQRWRLLLCGLARPGLQVDSQPHPGWVAAATAPLPSRSNVSSRPPRAVCIRIAKTLPALGACRLGNCSGASVGNGQVCVSTRFALPRVYFFRPRAPTCTG